MRPGQDMFSLKYAGYSNVAIAVNADVGMCLLADATPASLEYCDTNGWILR